VDSAPFLCRVAVVAVVGLPLLASGVARERALVRIAVSVHLVFVPARTSQRVRSYSRSIGRVACPSLRRLIVVGRRGGLGIWMPLSDSLKVELEVRVRLW
jgi:hypothetical protein